MKNKKKMTILVIQLLALILFVFSYKSYTDSVVKPVTVYQFARTMNEGTKIEAKDLVATQVAANTYKSNMILASDVSSIIGKYTTCKVYENTLCYAAQFGALNTSNSMFASLDLTNAVLMSLAVNMDDVGGFLAPGDKINLIFTASGTASIINLNTSSNSGEDGESGEGTSETSETFYYSKTFLQEVVVYDVLNNNGFKYVYRTDRYAGEIASGVDVADPSTVDSGNIAYLLLIVSPEEAEQIKTREGSGTITVVKRFDETETHDTLGYIIGNYGKVFSGNANAETGSLQIISTIQDTDSDGNSYSTGTGNTNSNQNKNNSNTSNNVNGIVGGVGVE